MEQSKSKKTYSKTDDIKELILELNKVYWESRNNDYYINSLGHYEEENTIHHTLEGCFIDLSSKECLEAFDVFKQNHVDFDARSLDDTSLLSTYAGYEPMNKAINKKHYDRMKVLLDYGANPDFYHDLEQKGKATCLMKSIQYRDKFQLLLHYGADPFFMPDNQWNTIFDYIENVIDQFEKNNICSQTINSNSLQKNIEDVKINRDLAQSIVQKQQISDLFQSTTKKMQPIL